MASLAQRLDDLAQANSDGLLNDDEYRILRQSLFELFAGGSTTPADAAPLKRPLGHNNTHRKPVEPSSAAPKPSPLRPISSLKSGLTKVLRRATGRRALSSTSNIPPKMAARDYSGGTVSAPITVPQSPRSPSPFKVPKILSRNPSTSSLQSHPRSVSSRKTSITLDSDYAPSNPSRSTMSLRRTVFPHPPTKRHVSPESVYNTSDDDHLKTASEIRQEIAAVEAEGRKLVDAFNSLELTTLTRRHPHMRLASAVSTPHLRDIYSPPTSAPPSQSRFPHRRGDIDAPSVRSRAENGPVLPAQRATRPTATEAFTPPAPLSPRSLSIHRKNSFLPVLPQATSALESLRGLSTSFSRSASHLPLGMDPIVEGGGTTALDASGVPVMSGRERSESAEVDAELADIRRRRMEVTIRCQKRLEYLRAKLKGAELHEKLLRK